MPLHGKGGIHVVEGTIYRDSKIFRRENFTLVYSTTVNIVAPFPTLAVGTEVEKVATSAE